MKKALGNPALAVLSTEAGQKALNNSVNASGEAMKLGFTLLKIGIFGVAAYLLYNKFTNSFVKAKEDKRQPVANVTSGGAEVRATNLFKAMVGIGANYNKVYTNLKGLNYNGYVRVFNAFGNRRGNDFEKLNLTEWLHNQFNESDLQRLRFATNNAF